MDALTAELAYLIKQTDADVEEPTDDLFLYLQKSRVCVSVSVAVFASVLISIFISFSVSFGFGFSLPLSVPVSLSMNEACRTNEGVASHMSEARHRDVRVMSHT